MFMIYNNFNPLEDFILYIVFVFSVTIFVVVMHQYPQALQTLNNTNLLFTSIANGNVILYSFFSLFYLISFDYWIHIVVSLMFLLVSTESRKRK